MRLKKQLTGLQVFQVFSNWSIAYSRSQRLLFCIGFISSLNQFIEGLGEHVVDWDWTQITSILASK